MNVKAIGLFLVLAACSSSQDGTAQMCFGSSSTCKACDALGCTAKTCIFKSNAAATCDMTKCASNAETICNAATAQGKPCTNVCVSPTPTFANACSVLRDSCGVAP